MRKQALNLSLSSGLVKLHLITVLLILTMGMAAGQSSHYWGQQYGTRSTLLGNSVIGGVEDLGAVFYNPARLSLIENPAFILTAEIYEWTKYSIEDAFGENTSSSRSDIGSVPGFIAGTFKLKFLPDHQFAFALLRRHGADLAIDYKQEFTGELIEEIPGEEIFRANILYLTKAKEEWYSIAWSYPISNTFSIGLTTNVVRLNSDKNTNIEIQAFAESGDVFIYQYHRRYSYGKYGLIWKLGISGIEEKYKWGLTITTPFVGVFGDGDYDYAEFYSGFKGDSNIEDVYSTSVQEDLDLKYHTPISVAAGVTYPIQKSSLHFSTEWFNKVPLYTLMNAEDHYSQSSGDTIGFRLTDDLSSVFNVGIGVELYVNENLSVYTGFNTDFSSVRDNPLAFSENEETASNSSISTNLYHFSGGVVMSLRGIDLTLGAAYTGGSQRFARPIDFPDGDGGGIFDPDETATLTWSRWRLILGFSFPFLDDVTGKLHDMN